MNTTLVSSLAQSEVTLKAKRNRGFKTSRQETRMIIGHRLRRMREMKGFSQGDIEHRSGLLRCYLSRVEHGQTIPSLKTLDRLAIALDIPLYRLFYEGDGEGPSTRQPGAGRSLEELSDEAGPSGSEARFLLKFR